MAIVKENVSERKKQVVWRRRIETAFVVLVALAATMFSASRVPLTWDEGDAFYRAQSVACWTSALTQGTTLPTGEELPSYNVPEQYASALNAYFGQFSGRVQLFSTNALAAGWRHTIYREGHPAGYSVALALGKRVSTAICPGVSEKLAFRSGPIFLFAVALAAVYWRVARSFGGFAGASSVLCVVCCPRLFGHAQLAGGDSLLISSWTLAWALFDPALRSKRGAVLWGLALGVSFSAKFSGFLVVAPFAFVLTLELLCERVFKRSVETSASKRITLFGLGLVVGLAFFFAVDPTLWSRPFSGLRTFWELNTRRDGFNIPIYFFGELYSPTRPAPWWNGFFWFVATIPATTLVLALGAIVWTIVKGIRVYGVATSSESSREPFARSFGAALALGTTLPLVRAFPGLPVHDGARLLIASFSFWGILAGIGAALARERLVSLFTRLTRQAVARFWATCLVLVVLSVGVVDLIRSAPQYLSFYNATVGGVVGATKLGLEPTYYWDALDLESTRALNEAIDQAENEGRASGVLFGSFSTQTLDYYRRWGTFHTTELGTISSPDALKDRARYAFYVCQRRPSGWTALDIELFKNARPIYRRTIANTIPLGMKSARSVAILEIYDFRDVERILTRLQKSHAHEDGRKNEGTSETR